MAILSRDQYDARILELVNIERAKAGLSALRLVEELDTTADRYAERLGTGDFFDHTDPATASKPWDRAADAGYDQWTNIAENIAAGYTTPEAVVTGWMNSAGHRANILNGSYTDIGIGYYYLANDTGSSNWNHYWVQVFGAGDPTPGTYVAETDTPPAPSTSDENDLLVGTAQEDTLRGFDGFDTLRGGGSNDLLLGDNDNDILYGDAGNDRLIGGRDEDRLFGGSGNDILVGGTEKDRLNGGSGNDYLRGADVSAAAGQEIDYLTGSTGRDTFVVGVKTGQLYDDGQNNTAGLENYAFILDLNRAEGDRILLHGAASDYVLGSSPRGVPQGTALFLQTPGQDELVAVIRGDTEGLSLTSSTFRYLA